jgi:hypothetical protein
MTVWVCDYDDFKNELKELLTILTSLMVYEDAEEKGFLEPSSLVYSRF